MPHANDQERLTVVDAITQLKAEILAAQEKAISAGTPPMFLIEEGELELKLVAKRETKVEGSAKGGFKLFVFVDAEVSGGASRTGTAEATQTLKIKFKAPRNASSLTPEEAKSFLSTALRVDR